MCYFLRLLGSEALAVSVAPSYSLEERRPWWIGQQALGTAKIITFTPDAAAGLTGDTSPQFFAELESTDLVLLVGSCESAKWQLLNQRAVSNGLNWWL